MCIEFQHEKHDVLPRVVYCCLLVHPHTVNLCSRMENKIDLFLISHLREITTKESCQT